MKKIITTICAVVALTIAAVAPVGGAWAEVEDECADYTACIEKADAREEECAQKGPEWKKDETCSAKCAETTLMGTDMNAGVKLTCDYKGVRIKQKLKLVIDIISVVVAALGVAAITYVGIIYLTAGPDVGKAVKARVRLIEIIIGLVLYALTYAILNFLIPNFG